MSTRQYDALGFPIPIDFPEGSGGESTAGPSGRPIGRAGDRKRLVVAAILVGFVLPAIVIPWAMPEIRALVVRFSLWRSAELEIEEESSAAAGEVGRAIRWHGEDADLYCLRGRLLLEARDPSGAVRDADHAIRIAARSTEPLRLRAIAHVCLGDADAALRDASKVCAMSGDDDPLALNFRAYVRALVGREIPEGLRDIERAIGENGEPPAELLDTHAFLLHLSGRHGEALALIERAIDGMRQTRRQLMQMAGRFDGTEFARRLRSVDHAIAVMLHHRGLIHESLGRDRQAREDFELARRKGFDPARGIL